MTLVLHARANENYGGNLVNQKYWPLDGIMLEGERADYVRLFNARIDVLTTAAAYPPQPLNLYYRVAEVDSRVVPMVVISSNRGAWMKQLLLNAVKANTNGDFANGYLSPRTFAVGPVPLVRAATHGTQTALYVVVHWSEYSFYKKQLKALQGYDIFVVAFRFESAVPDFDIVGLGACRYAALQFLVHLGYHRAWVVDDNVVNINGFPETLAPVEAHMPLGSPIWGVGFTGTTSNIVEQDLDNGTVTFQAVPYNFANTKPAFLQQVVLWNVDKFSDYNLNFCPLFVTSNEDIAFCNFLLRNHFDHRRINSLSVIKRAFDRPHRLKAVSPRHRRDLNRRYAISQRRRGAKARNIAARGLTSSRQVQTARNTTASPPRRDDARSNGIAALDILVRILSYQR